MYVSADARLIPCYAHAVWHSRHEAVPDTSQAQPERACLSPVPDGGVWRLLGEPECCQWGGAAVPQVQPNCGAPPRLLPLLQRECLSMQTLQVSASHVLLLQFFKLVVRTQVVAAVGTA